MRCSQPCQPTAAPAEMAAPRSCSFPDIGSTSSQKRVYLSSLLSDYRCLRALVQRNASQPTVPDEQRLHTPFVVLYTLPHESGPPEAPVVEISPDNTEVIFDFKASPRAAPTRPSRNASDLRLA